MMHRISEITTISVSRETHEALKQLGKYGDSMDDIICYLIEMNHTKATVGITNE